MGECSRYGSGMKSPSRDAVTHRLNKCGEIDASGICRLIALMAGKMPAPQANYILSPLDCKGVMGF